MKDIVIIGAGGHGKVVLDACLTSGRVVRGFLDAAKNGPGPMGVPVLGNDSWLSDPSNLKDIEIAVGVGLPHAHRRITEMAQQNGADFATICHPSAIISRSVHLQPGCFVNVGVVINADTSVGEHCILNTRVTIDHDCLLGDFVNLAPGVTLAGGVTCGDGVFVGVAASICPGVTLGEGVTVGAGAVVLQDVASGTTVAGVPAKPIG